MNTRETPGKRYAKGKDDRSRVNRISKLLATSENYLLSTENGRYDLLIETC
jgi:hypothetical protein